MAGPVKDKKLLKRTERTLEIMPTYPDFSIEDAYIGPVAAIDEVGRGPWAGPVVATAVVLNRQLPLPPGINDSKKVSKAKREALYEWLMAHALVGIGVADVGEIDQFNILGATKKAMQRAYQALGIEAEVALIDGNRAPDLPCETRCVIKGDSMSLSIAAASIVAKVTRDRMMEELAQKYPGYGWEKNAGYGTAEHQAGLRAQGLTPEHRRSFSPIRQIMQAQEQAAENVMEAEDETPILAEPAVTRPQLSLL